MVMQVLPRTPGFVDTFGQGFGQSLAQLAQDKYGELQKGKITRQLETMGVPGADAQFIAGLPQKFQLQALSMLNLGGDEQQQAQSNPLQQLMGQLAPQQQQQNPMQQMGNLNGLQNLPISELLSQLQGKPSQAMPVMQQKLQQNPLQQIHQKQPVNNKLPEQQKLPDPIVLNKNYKSSLIGGAVTSQQVNAMRERQKEIDKETLPLYDKIVAEKEVADMSDKRLGKMKELIKKDRLAPAGLYRFLKGIEDLSPSSGAQAGGLIGSAVGGVPGAVVGAAIGGLASPVASVLRVAQNAGWENTEEFEKLSTDFVRDAKNIFGSRITDADLQTFMQMIPTLAQTNKGKLDIINNMELFNSASQVKYKNMKKIIHENGGRRPENFALILEERSKPELDRIATKFKLG